MNRSKIFFFPVAVFLCTMVAGHSLSAQDDEGVGRRRLNELRRVKLIEALDLTEDQSARYLVREKEFRSSEAELNEKRQTTLEHLRSLVKDDGSAQDIQKDIVALTSIGNEILHRRQEFVLGLKDILSMKQIGKLVVFEDSFMKEVRRILLRAGRRQNGNRP